jgi:hypothetical protein
MNHLKFLRNLGFAMYLFLAADFELAYGQFKVHENTPQKMDWIFKSLVRDAGNEVSAVEVKKNTACPQSDLFTENFKPTFTFTKKFPADEFSIYELSFDQSGQIVNKTNGSATDWYGEMQMVQSGIAKVVLKKKTCPKTIEFGFFNTKTQRLCSDIDATLLSNKKDKGNKDFNTCIDWAKYLNNPKRQEIDITIDSEDEFGNSPTSFIGFTRFTDKQKPIVGKDQSDWYCFANCPTGKSGKFNRE